MVLFIHRLLYVDSPEKKLEATNYINQNFPSPKHTVYWLEGYYVHFSVEEYLGPKYYDG